jgi:hypothetical protein
MIIITHDVLAVADLSSSFFVLLFAVSSFEENAESECERFVNEALKYDPENPEVHQTMASLRISQNRKDDALRSLTHGHQLWAHIGMRHSFKLSSHSLTLFTLHLLIIMSYVP